mgnify:CR=1 FL=1|jgi:hypothetical protein
MRTLLLLFFIIRDVYRSVVLLSGCRTTSQLSSFLDRHILVAIDLVSMHHGVYLSPQSSCFRRSSQGFTKSVGQPRTIQLLHGRGCQGVHDDGRSDFKKAAYPGCVSLAKIICGVPRDAECKVKCLERLELLDIARCPAGIRGLVAEPRRSHVLRFVFARCNSVAARWHLRPSEQEAERVLLRLTKSTAAVLRAAGRGVAAGNEVEQQADGEV